MKNTQSRSVLWIQRTYILFSIFALFFGLQLNAEGKKENQVLDWEGERKQFVHKIINIEELGLKSQTHYILENFAIHSGVDQTPIPIEQVEGNLKYLTLGYQLRKIESKFKSIALTSGSKEKSLNLILK